MRLPAECPPAQDTHQLPDQGLDKPPRSARSANGVLQMPGDYGGYLASLTKVCGGGRDINGAPCAPPIRPSALCGSTLSLPSRGDRDAGRCIVIWDSEI